MKNRIISIKENLFPFSWNDLFKTFLILAGITLTAFLLRLFDGEDTSIPMLFVMGAFLISRYTNGYLFGTMASIIGVFLVNYVFTYPYFKFDFTVSGYPVTFMCMFVTSVMTSALTTKNKQQEKLRIETEKERMRGNLLRAVSHDLRTPLTSILGTTSVLLENDDKISKEKQRELLQESHDDAEWLIRMVENLLSITRINGIEAKIKKAPEAAEEIVGEAVNKFKKRFPDASVSVSVPEELLILPMDAILIEQVLINLLENAVLHGKCYEGIELSVVELDDDVIFKVSDIGRGISSEMFEHLFDGYLSGNKEDESDNKRSMGIGLSVCMSIVKAHGGKMTAKNKKNGGAEFCFILPTKED